MKSSKLRALLPTTLSSEELQGIASDIRQRSIFSARVMNAQFLSDIGKTVDEMVQPRKVEGVTKGLSLADAKSQLTESLKSIKYAPEQSSIGTVKDLSGEPRLTLIVETQVKMAHGYGQWAQGQDPDILDVWPAQELYRAEERKEPRDWVSRWTEAGGELFDGRMIALKNDPIWTDISAFGLPYPPFDFNSGMGVMDIRRSEAEALGLISIDETLTPEKLPFDDVKFSPRLTPDLMESLIGQLGADYEFIEGVLQLVNEFEPTQGQKLAGNYPKKHLTFDGLLISIETEKGQTRNGTDRKTGKSWSVVMPVDYGYIRGTKAADAEHLDVFVGPQWESDRIFVIDQIDPVTARFDEHKTMIGFTKLKSALEAYRSSFSDGYGKARIGDVTEFTWDEFRQWIQEYNLTRPLSQTVNREQGMLSIPDRRTLMSSPRRESLLMANSC